MHTKALQYPLPKGILQQGVESELSMTTFEDKLKRLKKRVRKLRKEGKTYQELGAKAGVASTTIFRIYKGRREPRPKTVNKILKALGDTSTEKGVVKGFASPFTREDTSLIEEQYQKARKRFEKVISDNSIPLTYKKELIKILLTTISSIERLAKE